MATGIHIFMEASGRRYRKLEGGPGSGRYPAGSGADPDADTTRVGVTSFRPDDPLLKSVHFTYHAMEKFEQTIRKIDGVRNVKISLGSGVFAGSSEPTWVVSYKGNGKAKELVVNTAKEYKQDAVLFMTPAKDPTTSSPFSEFEFGQKIGPKMKTAIENQLKKASLGCTWSKTIDRRYILSVACVQQWGNDPAAVTKTMFNLSKEFRRLKIKVARNDYKINVEVVEKDKGYAHATEAAKFEKIDAVDFPDLEAALAADGNYPDDSWADNLKGHTAVPTTGDSVMAIFLEKFEKKSESLKYRYVRVAEGGPGSGRYPAGSGTDPDSKSVAKKGHAIITGQLDNIHAHLVKKAISKIPSVFTNGITVTIGKTINSGLAEHHPGTGKIVINSDELKMRFFNDYDHMQKLFNAIPKDEQKKVNFSYSSSHGSPYGLKGPEVTKEIWNHVIAHEVGHAFFDTLPNDSQDKLLKIFSKLKTPIVHKYINSYNDRAADAEVGRFDPALDKNWVNKKLGREQVAEAFRLFATKGLYKKEFSKILKSKKLGESWPYVRVTKIDEIGTSTSGNYGHAGRPGEVGGSAPGGASDLLGDTIQKSSTAVLNRSDEKGGKVTIKATKDYNFVPSSLIGEKDIVLAVHSDINHKDIDELKEDLSIVPESEKKLIKAVVLSKDFTKSGDQIGSIISSLGKPIQFSILPNAAGVSIPQEGILSVGDRKWTTAQLKQQEPFMRDEEATRPRILMHEVGHMLAMSFLRDSDITVRVPFKMFIDNVFATSMPMTAVSRLGAEEMFAEGYSLYHLGKKYPDAMDKVPPLIKSWLDRRYKNKKNESINEIGTSTSGNYGHYGRPGEVGGSAPSSGNGGDSPETEDSKLVNKMLGQAPKTKMGAAAWRRQVSIWYKNNPKFAGVCDAIVAYAQGKFPLIRAACLRASGHSWQEIKDIVYPKSLMSIESLKATLVGDGKDADTAPLAGIRTLVNMLDGQSLEKENPSHAGVVESARLLNLAIDSASPSPTSIFRGIYGGVEPYYDAGNPRTLDFLKSLNAGDNIELHAPTSASSDEEEALRFSFGVGGHARSKANFDKEITDKKFTISGILLEIEGARGLNIAALSPWNQKEFLTRGRFKVVYNEYKELRSKFDVELKGAAANGNRLIDRIKKSIDDGLKYQKEDRVLDIHFARWLDARGHIIGKNYNAKGRLALANEKVMHVRLKYIGPPSNKKSSSLKEESRPVSFSDVTSPWLWSIFANGLGDEDKRDGATPAEESITEIGTSSSGNYGHYGRPGEVGGSSVLPGMDAFPVNFDTPDFRDYFLAVPKGKKIGDILGEGPQQNFGVRVFKNANAARKEAGGDPRRLWRIRLDSDKEVSVISTSDKELISKTSHDLLREYRWEFDNLADAEKQTRDFLDGKNVGKSGTVNIDNSDMSMGSLADVLVRSNGEYYLNSKYRITDYHSEEDHAYYRKSNVSRLTFYHGTTDDILNDILENGLLPPGFSSKVKKVYGNQFYQGDRAGAVFFTNSLPNAKKWADCAAKGLEKYDTDRVVLKIKIPKGTKFKFDDKGSYLQWRGGPRCYYMNRKIEPDWIVGFVRIGRGGKDQKFSVIHDKGKPVVRQIENFVENYEDGYIMYSPIICLPNGLPDTVRESFRIGKNYYIKEVGTSMSGNHGHAGRPGEVGGSAPQGFTPADVKIADEKVNIPDHPPVTVVRIKGVPVAIVRVSKRNSPDKEIIALSGKTVDNQPVNHIAYVSSENNTDEIKKLIIEQWKGRDFSFGAPLDTRIATPKVIDEKSDVLWEKTCKSYVEWGFFYDKEGHIVVEGRGEEDKLPFFYGSPQDGITFEGGAVIHTHPPHVGETNVPVSRGDILWAWYNNAEKICAISKTKIYTVTKPPTGWPKSFLEMQAITEQSFKMADEFSSHVALKYFAKNKKQLGPITRRNLYLIGLERAYQKLLPEAGIGFKVEKVGKKHISISMSNKYGFIKEQELYESFIEPKKDNNFIDDSEFSELFRYYKDLLAKELPTSSSADVVDLSDNELENDPIVKSSLVDVFNETIKIGKNYYIKEGGPGSGRYPKGSGKEKDSTPKDGDASFFNFGAGDVPDSEIKADSFGKDKLNPDVNLDAEAKTALHYYQSSGFMLINAVLRKGEKPDSKFITRDIARIVSVMKPLMEGVVLYRGINLNDDLQSKLIEGSEFVDNGFISTSMIPGIAGRFSRNVNSALMKINVPKGTDGFYFDKRVDSERQEFEVLLAKGLKFRVRKVSRNKFNKPIIELDVVGK